MHLFIRKLIWFCLVLFAINSNSYCQTLTKLLIIEYSNQEITSSHKVNRPFSSVIKRDLYLKQHILNLYKNGFICASVDSITDQNKTQVAHVSKGEIFTYIKISSQNIDPKLLRRLNFREGAFQNKVLNPKKLSNYFEEVLTYLENNGYPFASVKLVNPKIEGTGLKASIELKKNNLIKIDSIVIKGNNEVPHHIIKRRIGIFKGDPYNQKTLNKITSKIEETPYIQEIKPHEILFTKKKTILYIYVKKRKANSFNGVLGILPNEESEKINFTGELSAHLNNSIKRGETIIFDWRKLISSTQNLNMGMSIPYLFKSPVSTMANFKLYKKDSTFLSVTEKLDINLHQRNNAFLSLELQLYNTNLLNTENIIANNDNILEWADVQTISYGLGYSINHLDYMPNPTKGYSLEFHIKTGKKNIKKNAELLQNNPDIYKELELKSNQYTFDFNGKYYLHFLKIFTLKTELLAGKIFNKNIFFNEMYRIGGLKTLRGFDEESIFATTFSILTFEYRFILEKNSAIFAFTDIAYYESISDNDTFNDKPMGIGMGIDFETKAGVFSFIYALGKQFNNPFELRSGKIHFGIKSTF